jgi:hypothetical protein
MRQLLAGVIVSLCVTAALFAQAGATAKPTPGPAIKNPVTLRGKYVTLSTGTNLPTAAPGERVTLLAQVTPGPKIHLYAPGQEGYLAVALSVLQNPAYSVKAAVYPPPKPYTFTPTAETVNVYSASFLIKQDVVLASSGDVKRRAASGDTLTIVGAFDYQACDDAVCYRPETLPVQWKIKLR